MSNEAFSPCISELETICATLENVVKSSFGPQSQFTLLSTSTGHVTLSSDGLTILSSLHLSHPIARVIVKSLETSVSVYGDGCKSMILYLSSLFRAIRIHVDKFPLSGPATDSETFIRCFLARSLYSFLSLDLPRIIHDMTKTITVDSREARPTTSYSLDDILFDVIKPVIGSALPNAQCLTYFVKVLIGYLTDNCVTIQNVQNRCDWFDNSVYLVPHLAFESSCVISGILLGSRFFSNVDLLPLSHVKFICLQCPLFENTENSISDTVQLSSSEIFLSHKHSVFKQFLSRLKPVGVSVIMCVSKMPDFCVQYCLDANVTVIDCVEETDLQWICSICEKSPICSMRDRIDSANIMRASLCERITFGQKSYAKLVLGERNVCNPKSFFLCAPSQGLCQQLKIKAKRCMKVVSQLLMSSLPDQSESLSSEVFAQSLKSNIISGSGYFEMLLCEHLYSYCDNNGSNSDTRVCCSLLQNMLLEVPKVLCEKRNTDTSSVHDSVGNSDRLVNLVRKIKLMDYSGIIDQHGFCLPSLKSHGGVEVFSVKTALVYATVSLAIKLLRMDKIIAAGGRILGGFQDCLSDDSTDT